MGPESILATARGSLDFKLTYIRKTFKKKSCQTLQCLELRYLVRMILWYADLSRLFIFKRRLPCACNLKVMRAFTFYWLVFDGKKISANESEKVVCKYVFERCCNFHYISCTDSIKPGLQFSFFILVWLLSRDRIFTRIFTSSFNIANDLK